ncbi:MAG: DNA repair protein RecO [Leptolyngbyaceae cyanobacterium SM1_3_5]|nr:DNA repair protein RecO [Leptolyngbyaceae cyanobacterium SM1_3_5]
MSGTYKAIGINLKGMPFGEADRLITVLTREYGLVRAIAPGSRKHDSSLRGRSGLFVVNNLLIVKGRNLDKITQAEAIESFTALSQDLTKLTASQYLAELALYQALSNQPQEELFVLLCDNLRQLEQLPSVHVLPFLTQAAFQLLALAGVAPIVHHCCVTQVPLIPSFAHPDWRVGFSVATGGTVTLEAMQQLPPDTNSPDTSSPDEAATRAAESGGSYVANRRSRPNCGFSLTLGNWDCCNIWPIAPSKMPLPPTICPNRAIPLGTRSSRFCATVPNFISRNRFARPLCLMPALLLLKLSFSRSP